MCWNRRREDGVCHSSTGADAEGRPALVAGESQIAGFSFPDQEARLVDSDGTWVNLNIELWTYE